MAYGDFAGSQDDVVPMDPDRTRFINRQIYCHHCHTMSEMRIEGQWKQAGVVFGCRYCSKRVYLSHVRPEIKDD